MTGAVAIAGWGERRDAVPIDRAVRDSVRDALAMAGLDAIDRVDMVVTVASDLLDGGMVATRSGIAGSYGRELMTVPSGAGHALAAAALQIESGAAETVLLAGWGEGNKAAARDSRIIEADPFYARPVGADAVALTALQAQRLAATGRLSPDVAADYATRMRARAGAAALDKGDALSWLKPRWCDGAAALVLRRATASDRLAVRDWGHAFEPYCPEPDRLDPAGWIRGAWAAMAEAPEMAVLPLAVIEAGAPAAIIEAAALTDLLVAQGGSLSDQRLNPSGGGAAAHFGPATGLQRLIAAAAFLMAQSGPATGAVIDLAGPIGQAVSVILLETRPAA
jgi:hypothetical protein